MGAPKRLVAALAVVVLVVGAAVASALAAGGPAVAMKDACNPASFNAVIGEGTCIEGGHPQHVTFPELIDSLIEHGEHPGWRFTPLNRIVHLGQTVRVDNVGGEFHTFSRTDEFGGGFVDELNEILGLDEIADGCLEPPGPTNAFVAAQESGAISTTALGTGTHKFICCIHPWMQSTLTVRD
jgi:plastocyanin